MKTMIVDYSCLRNSTFGTDFNLNIFNVTLASDLQSFTVGEEFSTRSSPMRLCPVQRMTFR